MTNTKIFAEEILLDEEMEKPEPEDSESEKKENTLFNKFSKAFT